MVDAAAVSVLFSMASCLTFFLSFCGSELMGALIAGRPAEKCVAELALENCESLGSSL